MSQGPGNSWPSKLSNPNVPGLLSWHGPKAGASFPGLGNVSWNRKWEGQSRLNTQGQMQNVLSMMLNGEQGLLR